MPFKPGPKSAFEDWVSGPNENGCLIWTGYRNVTGYGIYSNKGAHRVSWERERGPIPDKMVVCHKCDVRECVNVDHLFLGTHLENMRDMQRKGRHNKTTRVCAECGVNFRPTHRSQQFCCSAHQTAFHNLWAKRGRVMGAFAAVMRMGKRGYNKERKYALKEFCALMDQYHREDRKAGRLPEEYVARKMLRGWTAADNFTPDVPSRFDPGLSPPIHGPERYRPTPPTPVID